MNNLGNNVSIVNVYRKVSNMTKPFWGVTANRIKQLDNEPIDYYVQFDYPDGCIVLTSSQIKDILINKLIAHDGDYKINLSDLRTIHVK